MLKKNKSVVWMPLVAALSLLFMIYVFNLNETLFYVINRSSLYLGTFWVHVTLFGDGLLVALLLIPFVRKHHQTVWAMLWTAIFFNIFLHGLKEGLDVARPPLALPTDTFFIIGPELHHHSFPSGHTATAFAFAGIVAFGRIKKWAVLTLFLAASLVGLSRIGVGVHWPMDILAGCFIGWGSAWLGWAIAEKISIGDGFLFQLIIGLLLLAAAVVWLVNYNTHYPQTDWLRYRIGLILLSWGVVDYMRILLNKKKEGGRLSRRNFHERNWFA